MVVVVVQVVVVPRLDWVAVAAAAELQVLEVQLQLLQERLVAIRLVALLTLEVRAALELVVVLVWVDQLLLVTLVVAQSMVVVVVVDLVALTPPAVTAAVHFTALVVVELGQAPTAVTQQELLA